MKAFAEAMKAIELIVQQRLRDAQDRQAKFYDKGRRMLVLKPGEKVLLKREGINIPALRKLPEKLMQSWLGPFEIIGDGPHPDTYRLNLPNQLKMLYPVFHVNILRRWKEPNGVCYRASKDAPDPVIVNGEAVYYVERILDARLRRNRPHYLVQWVGYPPDEATWEPLAHVQDTIALDEWEKAHGPLMTNKNKRQRCL